MGKLSWDSEAGNGLVIGIGLLMSYEFYWTQSIKGGIFLILFLTLIYPSLNLGENIAVNTCLLGLKAAMPSSWPLPFVLKPSKNTFCGAGRAVKQAGAGKSLRSGTIHWGYSQINQYSVHMSQSTAAWNWNEIYCCCLWKGQSLSVPKPAGPDGVIVLTSPSKGVAAQCGNCTLLKHYSNYTQKYK